MLSFAASNALLWLTYGFFVLFAVGVSWRLSSSLRGEFLAANGTAWWLPLMMNFIASNLGTVPFIALPQLATQAGLHSLLVFVLNSAYPLLFFAWIGSAIRRQCPEGFLLTEWTRQRYGSIAAIYLSIIGTISLFIFGVSELSAVGQCVTALTGMDAVPTMVVEVAVTTIYTSIGGFKITFITDYLQGALICILVLVLAVVVGTQARIDTALIQPSSLLQPNLVGWQILWILTSGGIPAYFLLSNFWMRAFASRSDRDLWLATSGAFVCSLAILVPIGVTGMVAAWSGPDVWPGPDDANLETPFFALLQRMPDWTAGLVLVVLVCLSTAAFGSLQCGIVSSVSNDVFRNRLNIWWVRVMVAAGAVPLIVIALKAPNVVIVWFVCFLLSGAIVPVLFLGLSRRFWFLRGFDVVVGGLGGIFCVFVFGAVYYGNAYDGAQLLILAPGVYAGDWAVFYAFIVAPVGSFVVAGLAFGVRVGVSYAYSRVKGTPFTALDGPSILPVEEQRIDDSPVLTGDMDEKRLEERGVDLEDMDSEAQSGAARASGLRPSRNVAVGSFW